MPLAFAVSDAISTFSKTSSTAAIAMSNCPLCGNERLQTIVDCADKPPRGEPKALCWFPVYEDHDPKKARPCGKPAVIADAMFPVEWQGNRCEEHLNHEPEPCFEI